MEGINLMGLFTLRYFYLFIFYLRIHNNKIFFIFRFSAKLIYLIPIANNDDIFLIKCLLLLKYINHA